MMSVGSRLNIATKHACSSVEALHKTEAEDEVNWRFCVQFR
jgi:hypothetical protein